MQNDITTSGASWTEVLQCSEGRQQQAAAWSSRSGGEFPHDSFSVNKLREKVLHPLLVKLGIPRGGFHSMRHVETSALLADGATPAVVQKQLRHSDPRITLGIYGHMIGNQRRDAVENRSARIEQFAVQ
jgi:integrase